ncbi:hypothetical protein VTN77DRAFT_2767 [Rasamsonia byssochlamydoides]|uniref:uncharacterized protein n=1 Tax=Rasamsonia byssochlamydoides TaxID=89139 RepID=UPI0037422BBE
MLSLTAVIALAVGCSVLLIVSATVGIVVWWRLRHDRLSLAMAQARLAASVPAQGFMADSSRKESTLPTYGQLPYSIPREWEQLGSQETFQLSKSQDKPSSSTPQKTRSLRRSLSKRLSLSKGKNQKPIPLSPLATSGDTNEKPSSTNLPDAKEKEPTSAVAGFSELPTEITPRHTPEKDREDGIQADSGTSNPASTSWPLVAHRNSIADRRFSRVRNGSITTQTAGAAPEMPMPPPPPAAYARAVYQLPQDDSLMRLSSLSLETANSSILDDGMRTPVSNSPALPPCPTFTPFSPYDIVVGGTVARDCASQRRSQSQRLSSSTAHLTFASTDSSKMDTGGCSPRRSLTTRESPQPSEWVGQLPRRSETVMSPSGSRASFSSSNARHSTSSAQSYLTRQQLAAQSHRQQRYSMFETRPLKEDQMQADDRPRPIQPQSPGQGRAPLQSAMKSAHGMRKGHRRQNSVRISVHPPITFGGPAFSPMLEEPEEMAELETDFISPSNPQQQQQEQQWATQASPSSISRHSRHFSTGSIQDRGSALANNSPGLNSLPPRCNISRKRSHSRMASADDVFISENQAGVPAGIFSNNPPPSSESQGLSRTPSPEKPEPLFALPGSSSSSSPKLPPNASTGSPRRSATRGPRNFPVRQGRNSAPPPATATFSTANTAPVSTRPLTHLIPSPTSDKDIRKSITLLRRMNSDAWDEDSAQYRRMGGSPSSMSLKDNNNNNNKSNRNSGLSTGSVTIWEDASEDDPPPRRPKTSSVLERIDSEGAVEKKNAVTDSSSNSSCDNNSGNDSNDDPIHQNESRKRAPVTATPNNKTIGLGFEFVCAGTPASLYDQDGFLKE